MNIWCWDSSSQTNKRAKWTSHNKLKMKRDLWVEWDWSTWCPRGKTTQKHPIKLEPEFQVQVSCWFLWTVFLICTQIFLRPQALYFGFLLRTFSRKVCKDSLMQDRWLVFFFFFRKAMFWSMFIFWGLLWVKCSTEQSYTPYWKRPPWMQTRKCQ